MDDEKKDLSMYQLVHDTNEKVGKINESVIELSAVVLGVKGTGGLISEIQEVKLLVNEMKLKTAAGEKDVIGILNNVEDMKPKVDKIDNDLYGDGGICDRLTKTETKQKDNRTLIGALWAFIVAVVVAAIAYVIHLAETIR